MNPGKLRHRIDIYSKVEYTNELNEKDYSYEKLKTIWAAIIPQTASLQRGQVETILSNTTHKIIVRYTAGRDITQDMYIMFRNKRFDIKYILNSHFKNEFLEIFCEEVIE
ncbi:phage head closure protein [Caminicella sporogenes]|uniref:phage head closure protein n=1 Tax=Caminicella sporogenes TaxID=166485 RepID=UPI00253FBD5C|nr:phage head closure protein [Caminicella sporogenes]WIF95126.1 phage head closure protein [Caminicella sporogenes]